MRVGCPPARADHPNSGFWVAHARSAGSGDDTHWVPYQNVGVVRRNDDVG